MQIFRGSFFVKEQRETTNRTPGRVVGAARGILSVEDFHPQPPPEPWQPPVAQDLRLPLRLPV